MKSWELQVGGLYRDLVGRHSQSWKQMALFAAVITLPGNISFSVAPLNSNLIWGWSCFPFHFELLLRIGDPGIYLFSGNLENSLHLSPGDTHATPGQNLPLLCNVGSKLTSSALCSDLLIRNYPYFKVRCHHCSIQILYSPPCLPFFRTLTLN